MTGPQPRSWAEMRAWCVTLLERTGAGVDEWNARVEASGCADEPALREWLGGRGVTGYAQMLVVWERFGYPDFLTASADELLDGQYADRPALREVYDAVVASAAVVGPLAVQVRKTYVCLVTPRRTFAQLRASTRTALDVGLRLPGEPYTPRLGPAPGSLGNSTHRVRLTALDEVDAELRTLLQRSYDLNL